MKLFSHLLHFSVFFPTIYAGSSFENCDENSTPASTHNSKLTPNTFHKICPGTDTSKPLTQPICGDGTAFSFYYHKPKQSLANKDKIIIEFQGGGACWDSNSCAKQSGLLTFPSDLDDFIGYSCSEANYGGSYGGYPINLLCADKIGDVNLAGYNYVFIPYCTQDVHMGDSSSTYSDNDGGGGGVYHHGAHNMMGALQWVYDNFPNPSHVFLTGCSAGGTVLPVAYDLVNNHYNSFLKGGRTVNINTIIDSAVYLTPSYFLEYGIDNWNPWTVLGKTMFPYDQYKYNINYSTRLWEHAIKRGSKYDQWGFVTHTNDPVSIAYWQAMGGGYDDDANGDEEDSWSNDLSTSLTTVQNEFSNVDVFYIDGQGHCSFGLQYALQEDGFEDFAEGIISEQQILKRTSSSVPFFAISVALGSLLTLLATLSKPTDNKPPNDQEKCFRGFGFRKNRNNSEDLLPKEKIASVTKPLLPFGQRFEKCPITAGFFFASTFYFIVMIITGEITHPLNNPSLGPSANTLSTFGINNPTLIVTKGQVLRLITSSFLCSGFLTYIMFSICVFKCMRHVEASISSNLVFGTVMLIISFGSNLAYTLIGEGASCGSLSLVLGMNMFSFAMSFKYGFDRQFPRLWFSTIFNTLFGITIFPFNNWIMIASAMAIGAFIAPLVVRMDEYFTVQNHLERLSKRAFGCISIVYLIMFVLVVSRVSKPDAAYQYPYLTGCTMMYTLDLDTILSDYGGGGRRKLEGDFDGFCAQLCVPHLIEKPFYWSVGSYTEYSMTRGQCEDIGYDGHAADKTITYWGYSLDIEAFYETGDDDGKN